MKKNILIAGVGGASLGTEIFKNLKLVGTYNIYGTDISPYAFGLYQKGFLKTYTIDRKKYIQDTLSICKKIKIDAIIPGGEKPMILLNTNRKLFKKNNIQLVMNSAKVIERCTDKIKTFNYLKEKGVPIPITKIINNLSTAFSDISYPCIIKPSRGGGGSVYVGLADDEESARILAKQIIENKGKPILQEYLPLTEGEYSFSVLSTPSGKIFGGIGIKKNFDIKLTYIFKSDTAIISSGYSQGFISVFPKIFSQVSNISKLLCSRGPLNIEGRVVGGTFFPFEINPRFSATTHLWAKAGFNDVDYFIRLLYNSPIKEKKQITDGLCLRSFTENFIPSKKIRGQ